MIMTIRGHTILIFAEPENRRWVYRAVPRTHNKVEKRRNSRKLGKSQGRQFFSNIFLHFLASTPFFRWWTSPVTARQVLKIVQWHSSHKLVIRVSQNVLTGQSRPMTEVYCAFLDRRAEAWWSFVQQKSLDRTSRPMILLLKDKKMKQLLKS